MDSTPPLTATDRQLALTDVTSVEATSAWLRTLRDRPVTQAVPLLLARLDHLGRAEMPAAIRLDVLRLLKRPVLKAAAVLPVPDPRLPGGGLHGHGGATMEQRLDLAMCSNLGRLFQELDRQRYRCPAATEDNRHWVLRNLFKFLRRQVRYALLARRDCPDGTWQRLHDLFVYLVIRGNVRIDEGLRVEVYEDGFTADTEYKRLLLMGRAAQYDLPGNALLQLIGQLTEWAQGSRLADPVGFLGAFDLLLVEVSHDRPLRWQGSGLEAGFRGWILRPDPRFQAFCEAYGRQWERMGQAEPLTIGPAR